MLLKAIIDLNPFMDKGADDLLQATFPVTHKHVLWAYIHHNKLMWKVINHLDGSGLIHVAIPQYCQTVNHILRKLAGYEVPALIRYPWVSSRKA